MKRTKATVLVATAMVLASAISTRAAVNVFANGVLWAYTYEGDYLPTNSLSNPVWTFPFGPSAGATESVGGGILTVETTVNTDNLAYRQTGGGVNPWNPTTAGSTVEARLKVDTLATGSAWSQELNVRTASRDYFLVFHPGFVRSPFTGEQYNMDTTDGFHTYRFTVQSDNGLGALYVDGGGSPVLTTAGSAFGGANVLDFGDLGSNDGGRVQWDYLRWTNAGDFAPVPEPSLVCLLGVGLATVWRYRRKR